MKPGPASLLAAGWAALLALLGLAWVNSPAVGVLPVLLVWSIPALSLTAWSWRWLGRRTSLLPEPAWALALLALWIALIVLLWQDVGRVLVLDGLILRRPLLSTAGRVVTWTPFVFALLVALMMLGLSLETRHRLAHPEKCPETSTPESGGSS